MIKERKIDLNKIAERALEIEITNIVNASEDSDLANYNTHLRSNKKVQSDLFFSVGQLNMRGFIWYKVKCTLAVTGHKTGVVKLKGHGAGFDIGAFTSEVVGSFIVDPDTIKEDCYFTLVAVDFAEGVVTFSIFRKKFGELCGVFAGMTEGLEIGAIAGKAKLTTLGF